MSAISGDRPSLHVLQILNDYWPIIFAAIAVLVLSKAYFNHGLNRYPGPFVANFTNAWRVWDVYRNNHPHTMIALHKKYGPIVRIGPNTIDISDEKYVPEIYGINKGYTKTSFYHAFVNLQNGKTIDSMFSTRNEQVHKDMKRPVAAMYSLSSLQEYEPLVDAMIRLFMDRLKEEFDGPATKGTVCDLAAWLQYYAFDVVLHLTFGNTMGFMAQGTDAGGFMNELDRNMDFSSMFTQMPSLAYINRRNPLRMWLKRENTIFPAFVRQQMMEHGAKIQAKNDTGHSEDGSAAKTRVEDLLTRFMRLSGPRPEWTAMYALQNVFAGSDTTAITLRAIIYFLLRNPRSMQTLLRELRDASPPLSYPVTWKESQRLPYLHAVVEESLRLFPAVGQSLEREVPASGLEMTDGYVLPPGTAVGISAWVIHRQESAFGPLPTEEFLPERWLRGSDESESSFETRLARMRRAFMAFGHGKRICLGRNISYLEIYKVIPTLLLEFDISFADPTQPWTIKNGFFVRQAGMNCWLRSRASHV